MAEDDLTITEFCGRNGFCKASYYELKRRGQGPRELRTLSKVKITREAEAEWREARQKPDKMDLQMIERMRKRASKGGRRRPANNNPTEAA